MLQMMLVLSMGAIAPAQDACPLISVSGSSDSKGRGTFSVNYSGGEASLKPTFAWSVSAGAIAAGQGGPSISVKAAPGELVTGTLDVGGLPAGCNSMASETVEISKTDRPPS